MTTFYLHSKHQKQSNATNGMAQLKLLCGKSSNKYASHRRGAADAVSRCLDRALPNDVECRFLSLLSQVPMEKYSLIKQNRFTFRK